MNQHTRTTASGEVIVMLNLHFKPGSAGKVLEKMLPGIRLTRMETGNNEFQMFKVKGSDDKYVVFERWKDQAALDWHWQQPYTKEALALFGEHLATPLSETDDVAYLTDVMERRE
ncbi:quinol monooxygenase YgiN [Paraburkholderia youngii]|uniref:Quinol monooxygenase YgiN n=1 Tax=Paraburkholderia youngii TaxID=2782701 RepID=A0A7W8L9Q0_9BURK|nr:antibiotic biosynthesis monooxygenase family protein [Paraburkholderia youngii]MBB5403011.1 quinol monooxygenase YgiN [Paraburkholderia youngii]